MRGRNGGEAKDGEWAREKGCEGVRVFVAASGGIGGGGKGVGVCILVGVRGSVWQLGGGLS